MVIRPGLFGVQAAQDRMRGTYDSHNTQIIEKGKQVDFLFIGDSITEMWDIHLYFGGSGFLVNRGVSGDITEDILRRWDADVTQLKPRQVILLAGTNDAERAIKSDYNPSPAMTVQDNKKWITDSVEGILKKCKEAGIKIALCTILPTDVPYLREPMVKNDIIRGLNAEYRKLAKKYQAKLIDYYPNFLDEGGLKLDGKYAIDGLHPNTLGYDLMAEVLYSAAIGLKR